MTSFIWHATPDQDRIDDLEHQQGRKEKIVEYLENAASIADHEFKLDMSTRDIRAALANALRELELIEGELK